MKTKVILVLFLAVIQGIQFQLIAQQWASNGAQWHYSYDNFATTGYVHIEYIGDTVLVCESTAKQYQNCKILNKTRYSFDYLSGNYNTQNLGHEYTWANDDSVLLYRHNRFYVLYDFSAEIGDIWTIPETYYTGCDTIGKVKVIGVGDTLINSESLRYVILLPEESSYWAIRGMVIEKIGPINWYMFPEGEGCIADLMEGGNFRCYQDDLFEFQSGIVSYCDFVVSTPENFLERRINVFPNPAANLLRIHNPTKAIVQVSISDLFGNIIYKSDYVDDSIYIDVSHFKDGLYLVIFTNNKLMFETIKLQIKK